MPKPRPDKAQIEEYIRLNAGKVSPDDMARHWGVSKGFICCTASRIGVKVRTRPRFSGRKNVAIDCDQSSDEFFTDKHLKLLLPCELN